MNKLKKLFTEKKENILSIYFTAGYPKRDDTETIIQTLDAAGADLIEIGMPYSDPLADGPTIQESGTIALNNGMTIALLFDQIRSIRKKSQIPLIMMGYFNQVLQYGVDRFLAEAKESGVDGLILPDLPLYEYETRYKQKIDENNLCISFLITPQTSEERIRKIDSLSSGFVYIVSSAAITGAKKDISTAQTDYFARIKAMRLINPTLIGFGISNYETYSTACKYANGVIIGSAFIKALARKGDLKSKISEFVASVRKG